MCLLFLFRTSCLTFYSIGIDLDAWEMSLCIFSTEKLSRLSFFSLPLVAIADHSRRRGVGNNIWIYIIYVYEYAPHTQTKNNDLMKIYLPNLVSSSFRFKYWALEQRTTDTCSFAGSFVELELEDVTDKISANKLKKELEFVVVERWFFLCSTLSSAAFVKCR